ncbi:MAG: beta-lactamase family protein [Chloroflexales bacterium]|nr:beta-lactamase family protein [Chloroflexales bacterium]
MKKDKCFQPLLRRIHAPLLVLMLLVGLLPATAAQATPRAPNAIDAALATTLTRTLEQLARDQRIPGVALSVTIPGYDTWYGARGLADRQQNQAMDPSYHFRIGSLSKMFVATAALQLVEEGKLNLDAPVASYLPNAVPGADKILLRHVMNHTSGLFDYLDNQFLSQALRNRQRVWKPQELLDYATQRRPYFAPGTPNRWRYSNTNYVLLGLIIEKVAGKSLAQELRQRVFDRAQLKQTFFEPDERVPGVLVHGYAGASDWTNIHMSYAWGTGSIVSTVDDLARFAQALFDGQLLKPETMKTMQTFVNANDSFGMKYLEYGMGLMRNRLLTSQARPANVTTALGHIGGVSGYRAAVWYIPESKILITAGFNEANVDPVVLSTKVLDAILTYQKR